MPPSPLRLLARSVPDGVPGVRTLVRAGLARAFGPPPFDPAAAPGDPGLFGPGSASWRVLAEPAAIVGGVRALFVQLLHPLAMAGVADHSAFRSDPLGRLQRTSAWVTTSTFGSVAEALDVARTVRRVHTRVRGIAPDGRPYTADGPGLLAWVSLALTSSFVATHRAYAPEPLDVATADAFVAEQARAAALLDPRVDLDALERDPAAVTALQAGRLALPLLDEGLVPVDLAGLDDRLAAYRPLLGVDAQGREAIAFLLRPPLPASFTAAYLPLAGAALATIEPELRRLLGPTAVTLGSRPARWQGRALLTSLRLATGTSPSARAAARRADRERIGAAGSGYREGRAAERRQIPTDR